MEEKYDVICMGMALVDSIIKGFDPEPISASGYRAVSGSLNVGGEAVNEAMTAAKLGARTGILCSLGADDAGDMILGALKRCGVDVSMALREKERATPVTTMFVNEDGTRKSITNGAHRYNFHPEKYPQRFTNARAVILGSLFRAPFDDPEILLSVAGKAKEAGALIFADTKLPNFRVLGLEDVKEALAFVDFMTPNEDEAKYYTGKAEPAEMADVLLGYGVKNVVIKLGGKGSYFKNPTEEFFLPPCNVTPVDATGAGDNFVAGLATEILRGSTVRDAMRFANACGAICTTAVGAGTALRDRGQVLEFLKANS